MKYFLGEIIITHKKTWFGWNEFYHVFTTRLVLAKDWLEAKDKFNKYADEYMKGKMGKNHKYECFVIDAI